MEVCNTILFQKGVVNMGTKLYNQVPECIKIFDNFKLFKEELKSLLFSWQVFQFLVKLVCKVYSPASSDLHYNITPWYCVVLDCFGSLCFIPSCRWLLHDCYSSRLCISNIMYCNMELDKSKSTYVTIYVHNKLN
jgi:hypothetical protein